jgi:hypothetical protein
MKIKVISGVLIFSLALNLAVIGTFLYRRVLMTDHDFPPKDRIGGRTKFLKDMDLEDEKRTKLIEVFSEFRKTNKETAIQINALEDQLFETLKGESMDVDRAYLIMDQIGEKKLALGKKALDQFIKAKSFLSPEQQDHFYRMLMKGKPNPRFGKGKPSDGMPKERKERMGKRKGKLKE